MNGRRANFSSKNKRTQNYLRAVEFQNPEWIPCHVSIMPATWKKYREDVERIVLQHPKIFPNYRKGEKDFDAIDPTYRAGKSIDSWGCTWDNVAEGLDGVVVSFPLEDWSKFKNYKAPDPLVVADRGGPQIDWQEAKENLNKAKQKGDLASGGLTHGCMFMRPYYLRGFENFMIDIATEDPRLDQLLDMVLNYNMRLINKWLEIGAEFMYFGDDLGNQNALPISPESFRKYFKPRYAKMFGTCREAGAYVYLHSDGHILEIIEDLIECGIDVINPQIRANGLEGLEKIAKDKVCIDLDLDRQLFPFASPSEIKNHIQEAVDRLGSEKGGLMLHAECEPDIPLENIEAICETFEEIGGP